MSSTLVEVNADSATTPIAEDKAQQRLRIFLDESLAAFRARMCDSIASPYSTAPRVKTEEIQTPITSLIRNAYRLELSDASRHAARYLFLRMNEWLSDKDYSVCDEVLAKIDAKKLSIDSILAILSISRPARDVLPARQTFLAKARSRITELSNADMAEDLLRYMAE